MTPHRSTGGKWRYTRCFNDTNAIIDKSDICVKNQVEADATRSSTSCQGTRLSRPPASAPVSSASSAGTIRTRSTATSIPKATRWEPNCGDHDCTVGDCNWHWNQSDASETCTIVSMTYNDANFSNPKCNLLARCESSDSAQEGLTAKMWEVDDLVVCDLQVKLSCD